MLWIIGTGTSPQSFTSRLDVKNSANALNARGLPILGRKCQILILSKTYRFSFQKNLPFEDLLGEKKREKHRYISRS